MQESATSFDQAHPVFAGSSSSSPGSTKDLIPNQLLPKRNIQSGIRPPDLHEAKLCSLASPESLHHTSDHMLWPPSVSSYSTHLGFCLIGFAVVIWLHSNISFLHQIPIRPPYFSIAVVCITSWLLTLNLVWVQPDLTAECQWPGPGNDQALVTAPADHWSSDIQLKEKEYLDDCYSVMKLERKTEKSDPVKV